MEFLIKEDLKNDKTLHLKIKENGNIEFSLSKTSNKKHLCIDLKESALSGLNNTLK